MHFLDENTPLWGLTSPRGDAKSKKQKMIVPMAKYRFTHHATGYKRYRPYGIRAKLCNVIRYARYTKQEKKTP